MPEYSYFIETEGPAGFKDLLELLVSEELKAVAKKFVLPHSSVNMPYSKLAFLSLTRLQSRDVIIKSLLDKAASMPQGTGDKYRQTELLCASTSSIKQRIRASALKKLGMFVAQSS
jgi:hypothetical protein